ncbi:MAG: LysR family transcriptional regulator [Devosiaceae bacterium]|nr:LysR family transcriptional regulator [Devosiaceae bacterium MH13]
MDTLSRMRSFVDVVREGGYSAASRATGRSKAILSKDVRELEDFLGVRLLTRTTRSVALTEPGQLYFDETVALLGQMEGLQDRIRAHGKEPSGVLRVSAPRTYSAGKLGQAMLEFAKAYPKVDLDLLFEDRFVDMVAERFDVAIRISELADSSLIARKLAPFRIVVCAAPEVIEAHGMPESPDDLAHMPCIVDSNARFKHAYTFDTDEGRRSVRIENRIAINAPNVIRLAALEGLGFCQIPFLTLKEDIEQGRLVPVLEKYELRGVGIYAVYPERRHMPSKLRTFVDFLADRFADER